MNPIHFEANFYFQDIPSFREAVFHEDQIPIYSRGANPTVEEFNQLLAPMEGKEAAISFASGMGAVSAVLFTYLKAGDHIIFHHHVYSWARKLIKTRLPLLGIEVTMLEEKDLPQIEKFIKPNTRMIYLENPTFFFFEEIPLRHILKVAKSKDILTAMDNTYMGPDNLDKNICRDIDFIIHSTTKVIAGHSDALGGSVCTTLQHRKEIFEHGLMSLGAVMSPMNAMLSIRGLHSYSARTTWIKEEAMKFVSYLRSHPAILQVNYPWKESTHPDYKFPVGLLSIVMKDKSPEATEKFCRSLKRIKLAVSYGGVDAYLAPSLAFVRPGMDSIYDKGLMRIATGLQKAEDLIKDFEQALK